jgi:hypothetical protein
MYVLLTNLIWKCPMSPYFSTETAVVCGQWLV